MKSQETVKNHVASHCLLVLHVCQVTSELQTPGLPVYSTVGTWFPCNCFSVTFYWDLMFQTKMKSDLTVSGFNPDHGINTVLSIDIDMWCGWKKEITCHFGGKTSSWNAWKEQFETIHGFHLICLHPCTVFVHGSDSCALLCPFGRAG